jgi:phosphatidylserine decarboxylase
MVKEGVPFISVPLVFASALAVLQFWLGLSAWFLAGVVGLILLSLFMAYFFRDPKRTVPDEKDIIVSAADGRVTRIDDDQKGKLVSVFLSPFDVHINRAPIAGTITSLEYIPGKKLPATSNNASFVNERNSLTIEGEKITVVCTQIAGILARRIVCWNKQGDRLEIGEKFGLIKFSSRTDLLMPPNVEILVKIGDSVVGGETIIGKII